MAGFAGARRATTSSLAKRHAAASENPGKAAPSAAAAEKRPALSNITNQRRGSGSKNSGSLGSSKIVPSSAKTVSVEKGPSTSKNASFVGLQTSSVKQNVAAFDGAKNDVVFPKATDSLDESDSLSVSMDESMSTCDSDSMKSPDIDYMDSREMATVGSVERQALNMLCISKHDEITGIESEDEIVDVDYNLDDPQLCATIAFDIYKHLRDSEAKKRPATNFMETVQKDINANMRAVLIDWLVEVAEEYKLVPDTLYLTVNYIDRYLSGNLMDRHRLQLLGVACMMIASKYEEICTPHVEEFCYITDNTYFKDEVLQMESAVLNHLKFEMAVPTAKCFLRRFVRAASLGFDEVPLLQLECMANYIAELSLLEYSMLSFAPSLIAASSIFLAKYILLPSKTPWDSTLHHYTRYQPFDLRDCVIALHGLCCNSQNSTLPAIREKYSQHKYKFASVKYCSPSIPSEYFYNLSS